MTNHTSVMLVARNHDEAQRVRKDVSPDSSVFVVHPAIPQILGRMPSTIIVLPGVDLNQDIGGEGRLVDLLKGRQRTFENPTFLVIT